jgi:hypothetical protein
MIRDRMVARRHTPPDNAFLDDRAAYNELSDDDKSGWKVT